MGRDSGIMWWWDHWVFFFAPFFPRLGAGEASKPEMATIPKNK